MGEFHFIRAEWFYLLLPLFGFMFWWHFRRLYKGNWSRIVDPPLQKYMLSSSDAGHKHRGSWLFFTATLLAITAMAGPTWERLPMPVFKDESAMIVALDLSRSMDAQDIQPSRLQRARLKLIDILRLKRAGQTALLVYAANAYAVTPLTDDIETIIAHIPNLTTDMMPNQGSRADRAIDKAIQLFEQTGVRSGDLLLITDEADIRQLDDALPRLRRAGHRLLLLGVGETEGAPIPAAGGGFVKDLNGSIVIAKLNESELRTLAPYQRLSYDDRDINVLLKQGDMNTLNVQAKRTELNTDTWRDQGPWLLLPVLVFSLLAFRRGLFFLGLICLLPLPTEAADWQSLWLNQDQRGIKALEEENATKAAELFNDPEWKAAAHYRAGQYEQALAALDGIENPDALYNKGNALTKLGRFEEAVKTYQKLLELNPDHEDAKFNQEIAKQLEQQRQRQQQNGHSQPGTEQQNDANLQQSTAGEQRGLSEEEQLREDPNGELKRFLESQQKQQDRLSEQKNTQQANAEHNQSDKTQQSMQQEQLAQQDAENSDESAEQAQQAAQLAETKPDAEKQAIEQWLRRVPDDPGGLLRRKFMYQYRQQQSDKESKQW